jgi:hypothetical protein
MDKDLRSHQNEENINKEEELMDRRRFLSSLGKWSLVVIGGALGGGSLLSSDREANAAAWANRAGGGAWANRIGGGGAWANRGAGWINRGGAWINRF